MSTNRTLWPVKGGALAIQPGWFQGHNYAFFYVNIGINGPGEVAPPNMSHVVVPPFQIVGPDNVAYNGTFCLPQVPLPTNLTFNIGDNITIQVIETAQHGAAIYNVRSIQLDSNSLPLPSNRKLICLVRYILTLYSVRRCDPSRSSRRSRREQLKLLQQLRHKLRARLHNDKSFGSGLTVERTDKHDSAVDSTNGTLCFRNLMVESNRKQ